MRPDTLLPAIFLRIALRISDMKNKKKKSEKPKVVYIDDGSTIADMSALGGSPTRRRSTFKEQFKTYIDTVKLMFVPMLIVLGIIAVSYLLLYIIL